MYLEQKAKRIFGLDLLRSCAILMVLCSNILLIYPNGTTKFEQFLVLFGFWGVEIFFVLSGFLVGGILFKLYIQDEFTIDKVFFFLKWRWYRTLPNYFLVLIVNIILALTLDFYIENSIYYFFFFQNFSQPIPPFFSESWAVSVGEFGCLFLILALFLVTFLRKPKCKSKKFFSVVLFLIVFFFSVKIIYFLKTSNTTIDQWNASLKSVVLYRIDSILIGVIASWISFNFYQFWSKHKIKLLFVGVILLLCMFVGVGFFRILIETHPFFWNVLYLPLTSLTFAFFLPFFSQWQTVSNWIVRPITFVSLLSYALYLLHYSIVLQLMKYFFNIASFSIFQLHFFTISYFGLTFLLSFLLYKYFEKPIRYWKKK